MSRRRWRLVAVGLVASVPGCVPPPQVPTRPSEKLARVELQINNTAGAFAQTVLVVVANSRTASMRERL